MALESLYGELDRTKDGKIASEYPAFYHKEHIEDLKETIREMKGRLARGLVPNESIPEHQEQIRIHEEKLSKITDSIPVLNEKDRDELSKARKWLGKQIAQWMFTYTEMHRGTADPHEEARRMTDPLIKLDDPEVVSVIKKCGVDNFHGCNMLTRKQAEKAWKLCSRQLGEPSNTETLRKA